MRRFFKIVTVEATDGGYAIQLDGRTLRSPAKLPMEFPFQALAEAVAAEWAAQDEKIVPDTMPLTQLASTAVDRITAERASIVDGVAAYAGTDLVCYRAEEPDELAARQAKAWQPLLDWVALRYDAPLLVQTGLMPKPQPQGALNALRAAVEAYDHWALSALQNATSACGSLVIALALMEGKIDGEAAYEASQIDETWQIEKWGADAEAVQRREAVRADIIATGRYHELLKKG